MVTTSSRAMVAPSLSLMAGSNNFVVTDKDDFFLPTEESGQILAVESWHVPLRHSHR